MCQHLVMPGSDGLFSRAIVESGDCQGPYLVADGARAIVARKCVARKWKVSWSIAIGPISASSKAINRQRQAAPPK